MLVVVSLMIGAVLSTSMVPLVDFPNHLARAFLIHGYSADPAIQAEYYLRFAPIPNVALDLLLQPLLSVFSVERSGNLLCVAYIILWALGCARIQYALAGKLGIGASLATLLAFNGAFQYGFVNYAIGAACALNGLATWLNVGSGENRVRRRVNLALWGLVTYLCHFAAFGALILAAGAVAMQQMYVARKVLLSSIVDSLFLGWPLALFLSYMKGSGTVGVIAYGTISDKAIAAFSVIRSYSFSFDVFVAIVFLALFVAVVVKALRKEVSVNWQLIAAVGTLGLVFLMLPKALLTASGVDARLPPIAAALLMLSLSPKSESAVDYLPFAALAAVLLLRVVLIGVTWHALDSRVSEFVTMLDRLPRDQKVLPVFSTEGTTLDTKKSQRVLEHAAFIAVWRRDATVPRMFAIASSQPLVARRWRYLESSAESLYLNELADFNYAVAIGDSARKALARDNRLSPLDSSRDATLYFVRR